MRRPHLYVALVCLLQNLPYPQALPDTIVRRFPTGNTRSCTATLTITSNVSRWAYEVRLDDQPWTLGPNFELQAGSASAVAVNSLAGKKVLQHTLSNLPAGDHRVEVRTLDEHGQRDASPFVTEWKVSEPTLEFVSAMPDRMQPNSDSWVEVKSGTSRYAFEYKIDNGPWQYGDANAKNKGKKTLGTDSLVFTESPRTERQRVRSSTEGVHTIYLRAVDECGNRGQTISSSWTTSWVSTKMLLVPPIGAVRERSLAVSLQGDTKIYSYEYKLNGASWVKGKHLQSTQIAHFELSELSEGPQHLLVRAIDAYGRPSSDTKEYHWSVDNTPPTTSIRDSPRVEGTTATIEFDVSDASDTTHQYSLDEGEWVATDERRLVLKKVADGDHAVLIRSIDAAGNEELGSVEATFSIDAAPPTTHIAQGPERYTTDRNARFWLTMSEKGKLMYSLDGSEFQPSEALLEFTGLEDGKHVLHVYSTDDAGNRQRNPFVYSWTVDTVAPHTAIHAGWGSVQQPRFAVSALPGDGESWDSFVYNFEYKVNYGEWIRGEKHTRLGPGYQVVPLGLGPGLHTITARGVDLAGNVDPHPASQVFSIPEPNRAMAAQSPFHNEAVNPKPTNSASTVSDMMIDVEDTLAFPDLQEPFEEESSGWFFFKAPRRMVGSRSKFIGELRR